MNLNLNLFFVHSRTMGYGVYGTGLAEGLRAMGVGVFDAMPMPEQFKKPHERNSGAVEGLCHVVAWASVPAHMHGYWEGQYRVCASMWESGRLPETFRETLPEFQCVTVPSHHNVELFSRYHDNVHYVPLGVDPKAWHYIPRTPSSEFRFLIGGSGARKGTDLAYRAFQALWGKEGSWGSGPTPYLTMKSPKGAEFSGPRIEVVSGRITAEAEVDLYAGAHCYLQPCFSAATQALTPGGRKTYEQLAVGDPVYTLDPLTDEIVVSPIRKLHVYPYKGTMVRFQGKQFDHLVTPNHRMYYKGLAGGRPVDNWKERPAGEFVGKRARYYLPTTGRWVGTQDEYAHLDDLLGRERAWVCSIPDCRRRGYATGWCSMHYQRNAIHGDPLVTQHAVMTNKVHLSTLAALMGWYISEGSMTRVGKNEWIDICNADPGRIEEVRGLVVALGLKPILSSDSRRGTGTPDRVRVYSQDLMALLRSCGRGAKNKTIPAWLLAYGPHVLRPLYDALMAGDGSRKGHHVNYYTSSDALKESFTELCLKLGFTTRVHRRKQGIRHIEGRVLAPTENWMIGVREKNHAGTLKPAEHVAVEDYDGVVWCVETEQGTVVTVHNEVIGISGNSRGEGFGLMPLQALAQGCPTILTAAHGHDAYAHLGYGISAAPAKSSYFIYGDAGDWWEPDFDELCDRMKWVYQNYDEAQTQAKDAAATIANEFTWANTAARFIDAVGADRLATPYSGDGAWHEPVRLRYEVMVNRPWRAEIAGRAYLFTPGQVTHELADVKRVLWEAGVLDERCVQGDDTGLHPSQLEKLQSASHAYCGSCHQRLGTQPTRADDLEVSYGSPSF